VFFSKFNYIVLRVLGIQNISIITLQEEGKVDVLANEAGDRITPAIVSITDEETVSLIFL